MPPTKEVQQDPKRDHDDKDHDTKDGAQQHTAQPVRSADDIVRNSLERLGGGGQSSDAPALSDAILAPPGGNFKWNAQRLTIEANLAEGKTTVSNIRFTVKDAKGNEREITGPSSYNTHGQQFVIDQATMQRFRVIPPSEDGGSAVLRPVGRRGGGESMTVVEQKNVEPYSRGTTNGRTVDGGATGPKTTEAAPTKQQGDAPVTTTGKPATGTAATTDGAAVATTKPATGKSAEAQVEPVVANTGTVSSRPDVKPEVKTELKPETVVRTGTNDTTGGTTATTKAPEVSTAQPAISRYPGGDEWGGGRWKGHGNNDGGGDGDNNRWRNRGDNDPTRADAFRQIREAVYKAEPPLSKDQLQTIREQFRQDPVKALQTVYQIEKQVQETRGGQPDPRQGQPSEQPRAGQPTDPRAGQPMDPRAGQPLDPRVGQGQPIDRPINQLDPRQLLAQIANETKLATPQPGDRGSLPQPVDLRDPRAGLPPQIGERPQVQPPVAPGDRGNPVNINPADLGKLVIAAGGQQNPGRPVDQALVEAMKNPQLRPALVEFLQGLQQGKLPGEQQVQQNKQLADVIKMLGPDGLNDIRRAMIEKDAAMKPGGEMKLDAGASNPRLQNILELITSTSTNPRQSDLINGQTPGALVSERLLAILRENDKVMPRVPDADATRANLLELGKLVKDLNTQQGLEAGKGLTIRDIIGRSLDDGRATGLPVGERRDFALKPQGGEDAVVKALLDRLVPTREGERQPAEFVVRTETMTSRLEPKTIDIKLDAKTEPGVKVDTKLDTAIVKPEAAVKAELTGKPDANVKPEDARTARDPAARPDGTLQPQVKTDRVADGDAAKADAQQGKLPGDLQNKDKKEEESEQARKLKEKERKQKEEDAQAQQDAALLALMNQKKRKETEDKDKQESTQEKDKKEPERRQKYIVKPGDTLETIAERQLRDKRLAGLIFEINSTTIPVELINGKKTPKLQERMVIWLPTPTEVKEYRGRLMSSAGTKQEFSNAEDELVARFGKNWSGGTDGAGTAGGAALDDMEEAAKTAYQARRKHIESLLGPLSSRPEGSQTKHVVRLGETLKSVAMKHPALQDVTLWKLLAELNGLPTKTDDRGAPIARLTRGQALVLPTAAEIEAFRQRESGVRPVEKASTGFELPTRACPGCQRVTFASASLCPACGARFDATEDAPTARVVAPARTRTSPQTTHQPDLKTPPPSDEADVYEVAREFSETARLMHCGSADQIDSGYKLRLEIRDGSEWTPVVAYEVFTALCLRHEYQPSQPRKTIRIDLPPQAATELAENDILTNWSSYETKHRRAKTSV